MSNPAFEFDHIHLMSQSPQDAAHWYVQMFGADIVATKVAYGAPQIFLELGGQNPDHSRPTCRRSPHTRPSNRVLSAQSSRTLEEVARVATGPLWFQSYFFKERSLTLEVAHRAEAAGYAALCLTLEAKVKPKRERNMRNNYTGSTQRKITSPGRLGSRTFKSLGAASKRATMKSMSYRILTPTARQMPYREIFSSNKRSTTERWPSSMTQFSGCNTNWRPQSLH